MKKEEDEQIMVELVECCPEDHHWEDQNGWRGAETTRQGRLSRDGHVVSRDGCVVKHALSIIIQIDPLYWMILGRRSAWL